jgi:hypothetical protein
MLLGVGLLVGVVVVVLDPPASGRGGAGRSVFRLAEKKAEVLLLERVLVDPDPLVAGPVVPSASPLTRWTSLSRLNRIAPRP